MLINSILYWDRLYTIVPASIKKPYENRWTQVAQDLGFLRPRFVDPDCPEVQRASAEFQRDIDRKSILRDVKNARRHAHVHSDKVSRSLHPMKVSAELRHRLWGRTPPADDGFYQMVDGYAAAYMSRLAAVVAEEDDLAPCTDRRLSRDVVVDRSTDRDDGDIAGQIEAMLASLSINTIRISPRTPLTELIRFRDDHYDELKRYRKVIRSLARQASGIKGQEFRERELKRIVKDELKPAHEVVGAKLEEAGFDFGTSVLQVSVAACVGWAASGFTSYASAAGGAAVGLAFSGVKLLVAKNKVQREPLAYLANLRRQFHQENDR
jgi:hypothetical protein